ncbi:MAG: sulfatase-like hydrolase/transferase [Phycisphaeraceae bacterium]
MPPSRPNILFICSDQHTARITGAYGDRVVRTPNLDALAGAGCRFDSNYCNVPVCVASRASFMTGRHAHKTEVLENAGILDSRIPTLAHMAVRGGYHAVLCGKMHFLGGDQLHGFLERPIGEFGGAAPSDGLPTGKLGNCSHHAPLQFTGAGGNALEDYDAAVAEESVNWLRAYAAAAGADTPPFFMTVGFLLPHCPYIASRPAYDRYDGKVRAPRLAPAQLEALHPHHRAYRQWIKLEEIPEANFDRAAVAYYALTDTLDCHVGHLLDTLRATGLWENTIVVYFSDHGEMLGQHGRWHKDSFFEDSARVPLIVRHPKMELSTAVARPTSLVDLMPTLCEWIGIASPPGLDGHSLVPLLRGETQPERTAVKVESYTFWEGEPWSLNSNRMVRRDQWKLNCYGFTNTYELYDLARDPGEMRDLASCPEHRDIMNQLIPLLFEDGWSRHVASAWLAKMDAMGAFENYQQYTQLARKDPLPKDPNYRWSGAGRARTWLEENA